MIINRATLNAFFTGLQTAFNGGLGTADTVYGAYTMSVPSNTAAEQYAWMASLPGLREWIGDRVLNNIRTYDYTIKNKSWESTLSVKRAHLEDDQVGLYTPMFQMLGQAAAQHPQELVSALMLAGFSSNCYDGQYFFDTDHPVYQADGTVATVSNFQGGAGAAWFLIDDTRPIKPVVLQTRKPAKLTRMDGDTDEAVFTRDEYRYGVDWRGNVGYGLWQLAYASRLALDETNFDAARTAMESMTGDGGRKLAIRPTVCLVGPTNRSAAEKLFERATLDGGAANPYYKKCKVVVDPWLQ
ncbi:MAG: Mu-like prophage major head subunit gpT family protein [Burkholderiales bacterium]|nr:Mu-like prophage major head subunit gpT family protein [Burkholderiales bacterium]